MSPDDDPPRAMMASTQRPSRLVGRDRFWPDIINDDDCPPARKTMSAAPVCATAPCAMACTCCW